MLSFSIESFLYECLVAIYLLFEAGKIAKTCKQDKNVADAVTSDQSNVRENIIHVLQMKLSAYNLGMEERVADGNGTSFDEKIHKTDGFTGFDDLTFKLVESHNF